MRTQSRPLALACLTLVLALCGCASTQVQKSWKSPGFGDQPRSGIAVIVMADRGPIRQGFENRLADRMNQGGQKATTTYQLLELRDIQSDKNAAAARLRAAGMDSVLIFRLVNKATYSTQMRATPELYVPTVTGYGSYAWYDYYDVAFVDMGVIWSDSTEDLFIDSTLFDLSGGKRLWSATLETRIKETTDRLAAADHLVGKVLDAMRQDGVLAH